MDKIGLFAHNILISNLENKSLKEKIIQEVNNAEQNNQGRKVSNQGGFQTKDLNDDIIGNAILSTSVQLLQKNFRFKGKTKISLDNFWINKNYSGNFNEPHVHPFTNFSGIYYLQVSKKGGYLVFLNNDVSTDMTGNFNFIQDPSFDIHFKIQPKENMFILFPSHMRHMVEPHYEDRGRISLAFNIKFDHG